LFGSFDLIIGGNIVGKTVWRHVL